MSLGHSGSFSAEKDSEFFCDVCGARCTRSPTDETEYGHLIGCPQRPDKFTTSASSGNHFYRPNGGESQ